MVDHEMALVLIGATTGVVGALVGSVVGSLAQHFLSLRAERLRREWDKQEEEEKERRRRLIEGVREMTLTLRSVMMWRPEEISPELAQLLEGVESRVRALTEASEQAEGQEQEEEQDEPGE